MVSKRIQDMIPKIQSFFSNQPIKKAWIFGSCSRGEETADSDIDILVEYSENEQISILTISRIMCSLRKILNRKVDLVEEDCLLPFAVESVNQDKILIYERSN